MKSQTADKYDIAVIGGGAAGLMAALFALRAGSAVCIFEKNRSQKLLSSESFYDNSYLGKKLLITGKGRCNLTNDCTLTEFMHNVPTNPKFLFSAFGFLPPQRVMELFEELGVPLKVERGRRVFPVSDKSQDILFALKKELKRLDARFINADITDIKTNESGVSLTDANNNEYKASEAIIATGGKSYPQTGSDGSGYTLAKSLGHSVTEIVPSLVPLETDSELFKRISGLSLKNVTLKLYHKGNKKPIFEELGEMLFTHFGVSGPLVLSASAYIRGSDLSDYKMYIDLKPGLTSEKLDLRILSDFSENQNKSLENTLSALLPKSLVAPVLSLSSLAGAEKVNAVTKEQRALLLQTLKALPIDIVRKRPIEEAIITSGGVSVTEINPSSMRSRINPHIFFAGEIIDCDAFTGGYNLQIAFSTGALAGQKACEALKNTVFGGTHE